jgi:hypothetical protein
MGTLGIGYVGGVIAFLVTSPVIFIIALFILLAIVLVDHLLGTTLTSAAGGWAQFPLAFKIASCVALALLFWGLAWFFIADAQKWVADRERTRHWHEEPLDYRYRRRRRRPRLRSASPY